MIILRQKEFGRLAGSKEQVQKRVKEFFTKTGNKEMRKSTEMALGFLEDSGKQATTRKEAKQALIDATKRGREVYKGSSGSGHRAASDVIINARENVFKPLSNKKKKEFNKSILKATYKQPGMKRGFEGVKRNRSFDTGEWL